MRSRLLAITAGVTLALAMAACGNGSGVEVSDAWARASAGVQNAGAVYMAISAGEADRLVAASVAPEVAAMAQVHETSMNEDGAMMMGQVSAIDVPSEGSVALEPGGFHIMLMELVEPLTDGATFEMELTFENAGAITVEVEVRDE